MFCLPICFLIVIVRDCVSANQHTVGLRSGILRKGILAGQEPSPDRVHSRPFSLLRRCLHIVKKRVGVCSHEASPIHKDVAGKRQSVQPVAQIQLLLRRQQQKRLPGHASMVGIQPVFLGCFNISSRQPFFDCRQKHQFMVSHQTVHKIIFLIQAFDCQDGFHGFLPPVSVIPQQIQRITPIVPEADLVQKPLKFIECAVYIADCISSHVRIIP